MEKHNPSGNFHWQLCQEYILSALDKLFDLRDTLDSDHPSPAEVQHYLQQAITAIRNAREVTLKSE